MLSSTLTNKLNFNIISSSSVESENFVSRTCSGLSMPAHIVSVLLAPLSPMHCIEGSFCALY